MSEPVRHPGAFFVGGGTMKPTAPSYLERPADREFLERLLAGEFCFVLTSRQMGKSSLMARTAAKLRETGTLAAVVDLTLIGEGGSKGPSASASTWYYGIARVIAQELGLKADLRNWWQARDGLPEMQRFTEFLEELVLGESGERRVVIFVDEIDATLRLPFTDDFFAGIRACYNARATRPAFERLTVALLGVASPSELIKDTSRTPFNIGRRIELDDFTLEQAMPLVAGLPLDASVAKRAIERVLYWTGGQPYLTQRLCLELSRRMASERASEGPTGLGVRQPAAALEAEREAGVEASHPASSTRVGPSCFESCLPAEKRQGTGALRDALAPSHASDDLAARRVDELVEGLLFSPEGMRDEVHFKYIRDRVLQDPRSRQVLHVYRRVLRGEAVKDNPQSLAQNALTLAGLVRRVPEGALQTRNRVYQRVFGLAWVRKALAVDPTRRRAFAVGALAILLVLGPLGVWYWNTSQHLRARDLVIALVASRIEQVPGAIENLRPLEARAVPLLRARFTEAEARSASQLNAALGLAAFGHLAPLQEMTRRDPNPASRTTFIHGYREWRSDPLGLLKMLQTVAASHDTNTLLTDFRSAVCAAFALVEWKTFAAADQEVLRQAMQQIYTAAPDGGSHGAAACALTRWGQTLPEIAGSTNETIGGREWFVNSLGMTMIRVPAGTFRMGQPQGVSEETPHSVTLTRSFFMADREVTLAMFRQFTNRCGLDPTIPLLERLTDWEGEYRGVSPTPDCPVQQVNWYDAVRFCNWLSREEKRIPCYRALSSTNWECDLDAAGYRLPTEAEWEYACRAVSETGFAFGDDDKLLGDYAWYDVNSKVRTWPAGMKLPNLWGLSDLHGNVWEWCADWYEAYESGDVTDPTGPKQGVLRVFRGGCWSYPAEFCRSAYRGWDVPAYRDRGIGFRVVLAPRSVPVAGGQ